MPSQDWIWEEISAKQTKTDIQLKRLIARQTKDQQSNQCQRTDECHHHGQLVVVNAFISSRNPKNAMMAALFRDSILR
jgi:hypothetical protein